MQYSTVISNLQNLTNTPRIKQTEIAQILGVTKQAITNRITKGIEFSNNELMLLSKHYKVDLVNLDTQNKIIADIIRNGDIVKIPYWQGLPDELKIPDFTCVTAERNVIKNHWGLNPENLCIVPMVGDAMTNYWYPIRSGDILIINTQIEDIRGNGVYFGTSQNNTRFWIREMQILMDMSIEFKSFSPSGNVNKTYSAQQLEEVDFKLIGKVIKNVSFRL
ncbi:MAG: hypothetical protein J6Q32_05175 [Clostridia bacterium]|nr:hypothetical protein [Clostridia bacterium]